MYIPIWLIIVGGIILFFYLRNREKGREIIQSTPETQEEIEAEESLSKISKYWQYEADVNSFFDLNKFDEALKSHEEAVSQIKDDPNSIRQERENFDESLRLSQRLWKFVDDVKYYPNWYENSKKEGKAPYWKSKAIQPEDLILKKFSSSALKKLISKSDKFGKDDNVIEYSFEIGENKYTLFINKEISRRDDGFGSEKWEPIYYYPVFIFENENRLVYQDKLYHENGEYTDDYDHHSLEAFKPGQWTKFLLGKIFAIRAEEEQSSKEFREEMNKEIEQENKEKFID